MGTRGEYPPSQNSNPDPQRPRPAGHMTHEYSPEYTHEYLGKTWTRAQPYLLLFSDSLDSVCILNSLSASEPIHTAPLLAIAEIILYSGIDLHVRHVPGSNNVRADMLSRLLLDDYSQQFSSDHVHTLVPPRELLPVRWRECF